MPGEGGIDPHPSHDEASDPKDEPPGPSAHVRRSHEAIELAVDIFEDLALPSGLALQDGDALLEREGDGPDAHSHCPRFDNLMVQPYPLPALSGPAGGGFGARAIVPMRMILRR